MWIERWRKTLLLVLLVGVVTWVPGAVAQETYSVTWDESAPGEQAGEPKTVERRVVVVRPDGEGEESEGRARVVFVGDGEGDGGPELFEHIELQGDGAHGFHWVGDMSRRGYLGVELQDLTPELRKFFGAPEDTGVLVARVEAGSPAEEAGVEVGDVITAIGDESVASTWDVRSRVRGFEEGETASVVVIREKRQRSFTATLAERERPEVDVRHFLHRLPHGPGEPLMYRFDAEGMTGAIEGLRQRFSDPKVKVYMRELQGAEGDLGSKLEELERQMQKMQEELERLRKEK
jgi:membrane-associated protease RseP (regulator of RpoE activity)